MTANSATGTVQNGMSLGEFLSTLRTTKKFSLRDVEEATSKSVSNGYLSQLEKGKIQKPSPNILHALAQVYSVDYEVLMEKAGYIVSTQNRTDEVRHGRLATLAKANLSKAEEEELFRYLGYLRSRRGVPQDAKK